MAGPVRMFRPAFPTAEGEAQMSWCRTIVPGSGRAGRARRSADRWHRSPVRAAGVAVVRSDRSYREGPACLKRPSRRSATRHAGVLPADRRNNWSEPVPQIEIRKPALQTGMGCPGGVRITRAGEKPGRRQSTSTRCRRPGRQATLEVLLKANRTVMIRVPARLQDRDVVEPRHGPRMGRSGSVRAG
jgi:hypothetical protein